MPSSNTRARRRRALALAASALVVAALATFGCSSGGGDGGATSTAPATTITATTPAAPAASETPLPTAAPSATAGPTWPPALGVAPVDGALAALRAGDWPALLALITPASAACTTAQGAGGPPKCPAGTATGTVIDYFPYFECDGWGSVDAARSRLIDATTYPLVVLGWDPPASSPILADLAITHTVVLVRNGFGTPDPASDARLVTTLAFAGGALRAITADCGAYAQSDFAAGALPESAAGGTVLWRAFPAAGTPTPTPSGVFTAPRERPVDESVALPVPRSPFPPYVRVEGTGPARLYDFVTEQAHDLGPGFVGVFSDDGGYYAWSTLGGGQSIPPIAVLDLTTFDRSQPTSGMIFNAAWSAPEPGIPFSRLNDWYLLDPATGAIRPVDRGALVSPWALVDGLVVEPGESLGTIEWEGLSTAALTHYMLRPRGGGAAAFAFDALRFTPAGAGEALIAAPAVEDSGRWTSNLFIVDVATGLARFVATAHLTLQLPLAANDRFVAWNEDYCDSNTAGEVRVYDRERDRLLALATDMTVKQIDGAMLGLSRSGFGVDAWLDLDRMQWGAVLPEGSIEATWAPSRRYAALGQFLGHGGLCG